MVSISRRFDHGGDGGFTYVGLLLLIALAGVALAGAGTLWTTETRRDREAELLFVGEQFQRAITAYYEQGPAGVKQFPAKLEDLLQDRRFPTTRRHLRKVFADPMTGKRDWGLVRGPGGSITGVFSNSEAVPIKRAEFPAAYKQFESAKSYRDWRFVYGPAAAGPAVPGGAPKPPAPSPFTTPPSTTTDTGGAPPANTARKPPAVPADRLACGPQQAVDTQRCNALGSPGTDAWQKCIEDAARRFEACTNLGSSSGRTSH
jgi:type II secretory pathway pseudopilin PulG